MADREIGVPEGLLQPVLELADPEIGVPEEGSYGFGGQKTGWPSLAAHCMVATNLGDWAGLSS